jgi:hypothetical protein
MINLRYHIVSLTAVFLAIGIGLTLGSTFLDRATVENLNGQLENLESRLQERNEEIDGLRGQLEQAEALQTALDEQGASLLSGRMDPVPVLVIASQGVDEADVQGAVRSLQTAGADVLGQWWLTERFLLADAADIDDLATALDETSEDPARLRRLAVDALGGELRMHQLRTPTPSPVPDADADDADDELGGEPGDPEEPGVDTTTSTTTADDGAPTDDDASEIPVTEALVDAGFISFEAAVDGPEVPTLASGVRLVIVGGSAAVPDDVFVQPLVARLARGTTVPTRTVVTAAMGNDGAVSEVVAAVRDDERLRALVSTVDGLDHFEGWMATVLAVEDLADGTIGHYGLGDGASALLPPLRTP